MAPRKTKTEEPADTEEGLVDLNAVIVLREYNEAGDLSTNVICQGDVRVGEIVTILEVAKKQTRARMGLDQ